MIFRAALAFISWLWVSSPLAEDRVIQGCRLVSGTPCPKADLSKQDLSGLDLTGADLRGANLSKTRLRGTILKAANLTGADLTRADLTEANLKEAFLDGAVLSRATLSATSLAYATAVGADFRGVKAKGANFYGADLTRAQFQSANLRSADLTRALTQAANFKGASRIGVILDNPVDPGRDGFQIRSSAFKDGGELPRDYSCGGLSPPLEWLRTPPGTQTLVLLVEDLDFEYLGTALPYGNWGLYNLPASINALAAGASTRLPPGTLDVATDTVIGIVYAGGDPRQSFGYNAPCPPVIGQRHRFRFTLWALNRDIPQGTFDYSWKEFNHQFAYTWVIPRVLEGTDPKYPNLSGNVLGRASITATVLR